MSVRCSLMAALLLCAGGTYATDASNLPTAAALQGSGPAPIVSPSPVPPVTPAVPTTPTESAEPGKTQRDIVLDQPTTPVVASPQPVSTKPAGSIPGMALSLLLESDATTLPAAASGNRVTSPVSLMSALGLVHAGTQGASANELSDLIAPPEARETAMQKDIPALIKHIVADPEVLSSANRFWLASQLTPSISVDYLNTVRSRFAADAALVSFAEQGGKPATDVINQWAAAHTKDRIKQLLPAGAVNADTQAVLTNALRFSSPWATAFDPAATTALPFMGSKQPVPTMRKTMEVGVRVSANVTIYELAFKTREFSLQVALEPTGNTHMAAHAMLSGKNMSEQFAPKFCVVQLPKFTVQPSSVSLKRWLQAQKVTTLFSSRADFAPMLGKPLQPVELSDVIQSAGIEVQEAGVEAVAATSATVSSRMAVFNPPDTCAIDRPFVFAIVHKTSGTPVFVGKITQP